MTQITANSLNGFWFLASTQLLSGCSKVTPTVCLFGKIASVMIPSMTRRGRAHFSVLIITIKE